nr:immunoglobulin light chain junction region [Macaca mulatta]
DYYCQSADDNYNRLF